MRKFIDNSGLILEYKLNFVDKCEWDEIYMRFDDWHGHEPDYDFHERQACKEWIERNGNSMMLQHTFVWRSWR